MYVSLTGKVGVSEVYSPNTVVLTSKPKSAREGGWHPTGGDPILFREDNGLQRLRTLLVYTASWRHSPHLIINEMPAPAVLAMDC